MVPAPFVILHGGPLFEITFLEYLFRVVLYVFTFGGLAIIVFWALDVVRGIHARIVEKWGGGENDFWL